jgi:hypothetical protein
MPRTPTITRSSIPAPRMVYGSRWNLATLAMGVALLIGGSFYYQAPDWDIAISIIMAAFSYLFAAWSMQVMVYRVWRQWPFMLLATWWSVDRLRRPRGNKKDS